MNENVVIRNDKVIISEISPENEYTYSTLYITRDIINLHPTEDEIIDFIGRCYIKLHESLMTPRICNKMVESHSHSIKYIPFSLITEDLCIKSVLDSIYNLNYIPPKFLTPKLYRIALRTHKDKPSLCYRYISKWTIRRALLKVDINDFDSICDYIRFVPKSKQDRKIVSAFINLAGPDEWDEVGRFINIHYIPIDIIPLLINTQDNKFKTALLKKLGRKK